MDWVFILFLLFMLIEDHQMSSSIKSKLKKKPNSEKATLAIILENIKHKKLLKLDRKRKNLLKSLDSYSVKNSTSFRRKGKFLKGATSGIASYDGSKPDVKQIFGGLFQRLFKQQVLPNKLMNDKQSNNVSLHPQKTLTSYANTPSTKWPVTYDYYQQSNSAWNKYFQKLQNKGYYPYQKTYNNNWYNPYWRQVYENLPALRTNNDFGTINFASSNGRSITGKYRNKLSLPRSLETKYQVDSKNTAGIGPAKQPMESIGTPKQPMQGIGNAKRPESNIKKQKQTNLAILKDCVKENKNCFNKPLNKVSKEQNVFDNVFRQHRNRKYSKYLDSFFKHVSKITHDKTFWKDVIKNDTAAYERNLLSNDSIRNNFLCKMNATCNTTKYKTINGTRKNILLGVDQEDIDENNPDYENLPLSPFGNLAPGTDQFSPFSRFPSFEDADPNLITPQVNGRLKTAADLPVPIMSINSVIENKTGKAQTRQDILVGKLMPVSPEEASHNQPENNDEVLVGKIMNIPTVRPPEPIHVQSFYDASDVHTNPTFSEDLSSQPEIINKVLVHDHHHHVALDPAQLLPFAPTHTEDGHSKPIPIQHGYENSMQHFPINRLRGHPEKYLPMSDHSLQHLEPCCPGSTGTQNQRYHQETMVPGLLHDEPMQHLYTEPIPNENGYENSMHHFPINRFSGHHENYLPMSDHYSLQQLEPVKHQRYHQEMMVPGPLQDEPMPHPYTEPEFLVESDDQSAESEPEPKPESKPKSKPKPQGCDGQRNEVTDNTVSNTNRDPYASICPENVYSSNLVVKNHKQHISTETESDEVKKHESKDIGSNKNEETPWNNDVYADLKTRVEAKPLNNITKNQTAEDITHIKNIFTEISSSDNETAFGKQNKENATLHPKPNGNKAFDSIVNEIDDIQRNTSLKHHINGENNTSEVVLGEPKQFYENEDHSKNQSSTETVSNGNEVNNESEKDGIMENIHKFLQKVASEKKIETHSESVDNIPEKPAEERNETISSNSNTTQSFVNEDKSKAFESADVSKNETNNAVLLASTTAKLPMGVDENTEMHNNVKTYDKETVNDRSNQSLSTANSSDDTNEREVYHETIKNLLSHFANLKQRILDTMKKHALEDHTGSGRATDNRMENPYTKLGTTDTDKILADKNGEMMETQDVTDEPMKNGLIKNSDLREYRKNIPEKSSEQAYGDIGSSEKQLSVGSNENKGFIKNIAENEKRAKTKRRKIFRRRKYSKRHHKTSKQHRS